MFSLARHNYDRILEKRLASALGDGPFSSLRETLYFLSLFTSIADEYCGKQCSFAEKVEVIRCRRNRQLVDDLLETFCNRFEQGCLGEFDCLTEIGMSSRDIGEILLFVSMTPFAYVTRSGRKRPLWLKDACTFLAAANFNHRENLKLVLKHAGPEQFEFLLLNVLPRVREDPDIRTEDLLHIPKAQAKEWVGAVREQQEFIWDKYDATVSASKELRNRMKSVKGGVELLFCEAGEEYWLRIDVFSGRIYKKGSPGELAPYHFATKRTGKFLTSRWRGKRDILNAFAQNLKSRTGAQDIWIEYLRELSERMLSLCDGRTLEVAKAMTRRAGQIWEIYRILRKWPEGSKERFRLRQFAGTFPALMKTVPVGFLETHVISGDSLRRVIPYWSKELCLAAKSQVSSAKEANIVLLRPVLHALGLKNRCMEDIDHFPEMLRAFRCYFPFVKQYYFRERFFVFMLRDFHDNCRQLRDYRQVYSYIHDTGYICRSDCTYGRLQARFFDWAEEKVRKECVKLKFPEKPWIPGCLLPAHDPQYRIRYIDDALMLWQHGRSQKNCVASYAEDICSGKYQIYAVDSLKDGNVKATVGIRKGKSGFYLDDIGGKCNTKVERKLNRLISAWFENGVVAKGD